MNGDFIAYDPSDDSEKQFDDLFQPIVAYETRYRIDLGFIFEAFLPSCR